MSRTKNFEESTRKHWKYVREVIRDGRREEDWIHLPIKDYLDIIGYHYMTAMKHGYKHGVRDCSEETVDETKKRA